MPEGPPCSVVVVGVKRGTRTRTHHHIPEIAEWDLAISLFFFLLPLSVGSTERLLRADETDGRARTQFVSPPALFSGAVSQRF